jgi:hypothetical protein
LHGSQTCSIRLTRSLKKKAPLAVIITQKVKDAIEKHNGSIEWILDQTATEADNKAYEFIQDKLGIVVKEIAVLDGLINERVDPDMAVKIYFDYLASKSKESRTKEWISLAAKIFQAIIGKKIPVDLLILATQKAYRILFGKVLKGLVIHFDNLNFKPATFKWQVLLYKS